MKTTYQSLTSADADADGLANNVTYDAGSYALSANDMGDDLAHIVRITNNSTTDYTGALFTITGTDANGAAQSETIAGPDASTTTDTTLFFATVTSVTSDTDTMADTFDIGWKADAVGPNIYPVRSRDPVINGTIFCAVPTAGPTYGIDYTADATTATAPQWLPHATIASKTDTFCGQQAFQVLALRLHFTAAGQVNLTFLEPYNAG